MQSVKAEENTKQETPKVSRVRRSPERILELVLESERTGNAAEICRREGIVPQLFYRWKQQVKQSAVEGLKQKKRGPKMGQRMLSSQESQELKQELAEVKEAFVATSMELALFKKRNR